MSYDPKIQIRCGVEYKTLFSVKASQFEGYDDAKLEEEIREYADQIMRLELEIFVENMPRVVAEVRDALRIRKEEEDSHDEQ